MRDSNRDQPLCITSPDGEGLDCFSGGDVMLTFFAVIMSAFSVGQVGPAFAAFAAARVRSMFPPSRFAHSHHPQLPGLFCLCHQAAGARIFEVIDRVPVIDSRSEDGVKLTAVRTCAATPPANSCISRVFHRVGCCCSSRVVTSR